MEVGEGRVGQARVGGGFPGPGHRKAVAMPAAATKAKTRRKSPNVKGRPYQRSSSQAAKTASPALQMPLKVEVQRLRSPMKLAAMVPTTTPSTSAGRTRGPNVMRIPAATPDAGQNTATSVGMESKASPSCAVKK